MMESHTTIVSAQTLAAHLDDPTWRIFDCRHDLNEPDAGRLSYGAAHIPGSQFLHLDDDLSGPKTGSNGRHPLPDPERLATRFAECGVDNDSQIVAYDDVGGIFASRLWWLARWLRHTRVAVLDGGLRAWREARLPVDKARPAIAPARFAYQLQAPPVDVGYVAAHLHRPDMLLVDARSPDRFRGENETLDPVGGRIPGSLSRFFKNNLDESWRFKPVAVLREEFRALLGATAPGAVVHTCGSGVTACHNLLAMEMAGLSGSRLYVGSWSEWCADPARPMETGA